MLEIWLSSCSSHHVECTKTWMRDLSSCFCNCESSQRKGQSLDLFHVCHILLYCQLPLLCSRFESCTVIRVWFGWLFKLPHTELRSLIHVLVHSTWWEEQDDNQISSISFEIYSEAALLEINILLNFSVTVLQWMEMTNRNDHLLFPPQTRIDWLDVAGNSAAMLLSLQPTHECPYPTSMGG